MWRRCFERLIVESAPFLKGCRTNKHSFKLSNLVRGGFSGRGVRLLTPGNEVCPLPFCPLTVLSGKAIFHLNPPLQGRSPFLNFRCSPPPKKKNLRADHQRFCHVKEGGRCLSGSAPNITSSYPICLQRRKVHLPVRNVWSLLSLPAFYRGGV